MPLETARGAGAAHDAHISVVNRISELEDAAQAIELELAASRAELKAQRPALLVASLTAKRDKYAAHLAETERNLATAIAALPKEN